MGIYVELDKRCGACPVVSSGREFSTELIVIPDHTYCLFERVVSFIDRDNQCFVLGANI